MCAFIDVFSLDHVCVFERKARTFHYMWLRRHKKTRSNYTAINDVLWWYERWSENETYLTWVPGSLLARDILTLDFFMDLQFIVNALISGGRQIILMEIRLFILLLCISKGMLSFILIWCISWSVLDFSSFLLLLLNYRNIFFIMVFH